MSRREFPKDVKRAALKRSGQLCEAVGAVYGLPIGQRCNGSLSGGIHFDHVIADGIGGEPTLENCAAVCTPCHRIKTSAYDIPRIAKCKRQSDKALGIRSTSRRPMPGSRASGWKRRMDGTTERRP